MKPIKTRTSTTSTTTDKQIERFKLILLEANEEIESKKATIANLITKVKLQDTRQSELMRSNENLLTDFKAVETALLAIKSKWWFKLFG